MSERKAYIVSAYHDDSETEPVVFDDLSEALKYADESTELLWVDTREFRCTSAPERAIW